MRKIDLGVIVTNVLFAGVCLATGWLLWLVGSTLVRDVTSGDWSSTPILLVGLLIFGAPCAFGAYVLVSPHLPRPTVIKANPSWMTEQLNALPFVTAATATAHEGVWRVTVESAPLTPAEAQALLETVWIESSIVPLEVVVNGARATRSELIDRFGDHPLSA